MTTTETERALAEYDFAAHLKTAPYFGLFSDDTRETILAYVRPEQERRLAIALKLNEAVSLCAEPEDLTTEWKELRGHLTEAFYYASHCSPRVEQRMAYHAAVQLFEGSEYRESVEARFDDVMNGPAYKVLGIEDHTLSTLPGGDFDPRGTETRPRGPATE